MQLSAEGLDLIKRFEGFRSQQYTDVAGFSTIGYGHRVVEPEVFSQRRQRASGRKPPGRRCLRGRERRRQPGQGGSDPGPVRRARGFLFQPRRRTVGQIDAAPLPQFRPLRRRRGAVAALGSRPRRSESGPEGPPRSRTPPLEIGTTTLPGKVFAAATNRRGPAHLLRTRQTASSWWSFQRFAVEQSPL